MLTLPQATATCKQEWHFRFQVQNRTRDWTDSNIHTQPFYGSLDFVWDNPGEPVLEKTSTHSHLLCLSVVPYLLLPSIMIHGILPVQFTCLTVFFHNLSPRFFWSTSWPGTLHFILHTSLHSVASSFRSTCPYHRNLFCCSTEIMSSNPSLSLNPLLGTLSCSLTPHIRVTILISARWSATSFSYYGDQYTLKNMPVAWRGDNTLNKKPS